METQIVPKSGFEIKTVKMNGFSRQMNLKGIVENIKTVCLTLKASSVAKKIIEEFKPKIVVTKTEEDKIYLNNFFDDVIFEYGEGDVLISRSWNYSGTKAMLDAKGLVTTTEYWCMGDDYCDESEHPHYKSDDDWDFAYDDNKHLIKVGDYCNLEWDANGNLNKVYYRRGKPMTFEYGSKPIENKMGFMLSYDAICGLDLDSYDLFTIARLLGAGSKHLPISRSDGTTFEWELDVDGYPIKLTINKEDESEKLIFAWE